MRFGFPGGPWRFVDHFGVDWRIALVAPSARRSDAGTPSREQRSIVERLVFQGFSWSGAKDEAIARALLGVYDELTHQRLSYELPRPTNDPRRLLRAFDAELRDRLLRAFAEGRLVVERVEPAPWPFPDAPAKSLPRGPDSAPPTIQVPLTWVEIRLIGEDDGPIAGAAFRIDLPDGTVREGQLDAEGLARVEGIDPGTCNVTFPELDKDAWARV